MSVYAHHHDGDLIVGDGEIEFRYPLRDSEALKMLFDALSEAQVMETEQEETIALEFGLDGDTTSPDAILAALAEAGLLEMETAMREAAVLSWYRVARYVSPWKEAE